MIRYLAYKLKILLANMLLRVRRYIVWTENLNQNHSSYTMLCPDEFIRNVKYEVTWYKCILGVVLTGGTEGTIAGGMGDGTNVPSANNVLDNYTYILLDGYEANYAILFRCATGLGPSDTDTNDVIGDIYYNNMALPDGMCSGVIQAEGTGNVFRFPGVYQARTCGTLTTSTEGVYTCTLTNSSMMDQSVSIGIYFSGRSKSLYVI